LRCLALGVVSLTGCALVGQEAPDACGFPDGAALAFAGRSTTSTLQVQEVVGDPMSDDPADIYITRDKFDQGQLHGRLVCAIFVNDPGFVEVTVHPADGGRAQPPPEPPPPPETPLPSGFIEIMTHCGLDFVRIEYEGQLWRFPANGDANPPAGWGFNTTVVELRAGPQGPVVIGPDGAEWPLILADPADPPPMCF
jgi:hypothetical protein